MAPRGPNPNVLTVIAETSPDKVEGEVDAITVVFLINQNSIQHMEKNIAAATRKTISLSFAVVA